VHLKGHTPYFFPVLRRSGSDWGFFSFVIVCYCCLQLTSLSVFFCLSNGNRLVRSQERGLSIHSIHDNQENMSSRLIIVPALLSETMGFEGRPVEDSDDARCEAMSLRRLRTGAGGAAPSRKNCLVKSCHRTTPERRVYSMWPLKSLVL
jgi:hypothetical protein